ncbi:MAG: dienelactone hydrolase family protein [Methylococcaceae bacterium]|jgi:dienelactone hydrolase
MKYALLGLAFLFSPILQAALHEENVAYPAGSTVLKGYLVWDDSKGSKQPGVLVVHEWWGLNEYARQRARMLAGLGYTALAVDMYGDGQVTEHASEASAFVKSVHDKAETSKLRFLAAKTLLEQQPNVDAKKIAAIGYCFGGSTVLDMARMGVDLDAVVSFHGNLATQSPAQPGSVKAKILVLNGADDDFVSPESIAEFKQEMAAAKAEYHFVDYPGAKHGFTNPEADKLGAANHIPIAYNAAADQKSWAAMQALFAQVFQ